MIEELLSKIHRPITADLVRAAYRLTESDRISHRFEVLRHIFKTFHEAYTIFLSGQRIGSHTGSVSRNIQHNLWLILLLSFKQRDV